MKFTITAEQVNKILVALDEIPFKQSFPIFQVLNSLAPNNLPPNAKDIKKPEPKQDAKKGK